MDIGRAHVLRRRRAARGPDPSRGTVHLHGRSGVEQVVGPGKEPGKEVENARSRNLKAMSDEGGWRFPPSASMREYDRGL